MRRAGWGKGSSSKSGEQRKEEWRRVGGGGSKRIIYPLFGEQVHPNEAWRAAAALRIISDSHTDTKTAASCTSTCFDLSQMRDIYGLWARY